MNTSISKSRALSLLQGAIDAARSSTWKLYDDPGFVRWREETHSVVRTLFGKESPQLERLLSLSYMGISFTRSSTAAEDREAMQRDMQSAVAHLEATVFDVVSFWPDEAAPPPVPAFSALDVVLQLCERFPAAAKRLRTHPRSRTPFLVTDEWDVLYLFGAFLDLHFEDVRPEEPTPSLAGGHARMDNLLADERLVLETKMTRETMSRKTLGDELLLDMARYEGHPSCDTLVCFVYDPEGRITSPLGLTRDIEKQAKRLKVRVLVRG